MTPDFIIIGAPKAGTTSLWRLLSQHPRILPSKTKEPGFFMRDEIYSKGWDWYQSLFSEKQEGQIAGEATTEYSQTRTFPHTVTRIAKHLPQIKLIFMMRHPYETLESRWRQSLFNRDPIPRDFPAALKDYLPLLENALHSQTIQDFLDYFPPENLLLLLFEDFKADPHATCRIVFEFLGVDPNLQVSDAHRVSNSGREKDIDTAWVSFLRRFPLATRIRNHLPEGARQTLRIMTRRKPLPAIWTREAFQTARDHVAKDAVRALEFAGKNDDFWDLSENWLSEIQ